MDELTLVGSLRSEQDGPTPEALIAGRAALFDRIVAEADPGAPARAAHLSTRKRTTTGFAALGAGALVAALVFSDVVGLAGWRGGADPAAAAVLEQAAVATVTFEDTAVDPGELLLVEMESVGMVSGQDETGPAVHYRVRESTQLYVPADREDEWVWIRPRATLVVVLTPGGEPFVDEYFAAIDAEWEMSPSD